MFQSVKMQMIGYDSWVELAIVNGQIGTYYMVKSDVPYKPGHIVEYIMKDYKTGDFFDEFLETYSNREPTTKEAD